MLTNFDIIVSWTPNSVSSHPRSSNGALTTYTDMYQFPYNNRLISSLSFLHRFILHAKKTAFVIEHDFIMATYLADRVIVFEGQPARSATATPCVFSSRLRLYFDALLTSSLPVFFF